MNESNKNRIAAINSGIIPEGYKKTKVGIVPVEWEIVKLSGIGKNYIGLTYTPEDTANTGLIVLRSSNIKDSKIDLNDCVYVKCEVSEKNRVKHNDILICARNGSSSLIGKSALITEAYSGLAFGAFMSVYRTKYYNYIFQAFQSFIIKKQILRNLGARINQITTADINQFKVPFPPLPEQQKIVEILSTQDKLIELQEKKIEQLKELKKAYLQKMFPKKGSKYPELRFKGFTDPWEQRKLSDTLNFLSNNTLSRAELSEDTGTYKNVHYGDVLIRFGEYIDAQSTDLPYIADDEKAKKFESSKLQDGDIIIADTAEDEAVGKCVEIGNIGDLSIVSGLHTIPCRPKVKFAPAYLGFYLNSASYHDQLIPLMQGIKVTSISKSAISDTMISAPTNLSEQGKIGQFFTQLDSLITLHQRKSEQEKQKKKALMQLLLTGKVRCI